jgi:uncharacterized membrane protein YphA (DoxX/SURF4 family)
MVPELQQEVSVIPPQTEVRWSAAALFGFRFAFCYFFFYLTPGAVGSLGLNETIGSYHVVFAAFWHKIVPWVGSNILGIQDSFVQIANGSGDQVYDYVLILCIFVVALFAAIVWTVLDRKRTNYEQLNQWLRLVLRLFLASVMMLYGASKLFPTQFAEIPLARLADPLGHLSPLGLLWTLMGYSRGYAVFGGVGEMLGGLLLVVPRFTTIGALVSVGVLSNVLMLNLCYDVPRKILTTHLIVMGLVLILPDVKRIMDSFFLNRRIEPASSIPFLKDKFLNRGVLVLQYLYAAVTLSIALQVAYQQSLPYKARVAPSLRGIWSVDEFATNNTPLPPVVTDNQRWYRVVLDTPTAITVQPMNGPLQIYSLKLAENGKSLSFSDLGSKNVKATFTLTNTTPDRLVMTGQFDGHPVNATLHRVDLSDPTEFLLTTRGFHWVTPYPRWR